MTASLKIKILASTYAPEITRILCAEGHKVELWWREGDKDISAPVMKNPYMVRNELSRKAWLAEPCDLVIANYMQTVKHPKAVSPSKFSRKLETDRWAGKQFAKQCGLSVPKAYVFTDKSTAFEQIRKLKGRLALKYFFTKIAHNATQALDILDKVEISPKWPLVVEQMISGVEIAFGWWVQKHNPPKTIMVNQEYKGAMPGNMGGVLTGESATAWTYLPISNLPFSLREAIRVIDAKLSSEGHIGFFDINTIFDGKNFQFLEFTARMGYPTESLHAHTLHYMGKGYGKFMQDLHSLENVYANEHLYGQRFVALGLYPIGLGAPKFKSVGAQRLLGLKENKDYVLFESTQQADGYWANGYDRTVFSFGTGTSSKDAATEARKHISKLTCYAHMYRTDAGDNFDDDLVSTGLA